MKVDYVIRGGRVLDPLEGTDRIRDIYIRNMRIVEADEGEAECGPDRVINAEGMIVTPGLIDFHTHIFHEGSNICIHPDMMIAQGTTAAVDAGSAGTATFEAFYRSVVSASMLKIKSFLTLYAGGQLDPKLCEDFDPRLYNLDKIERLVDTYRDNILGFKIRLSKGVVPDETGAEYLKAVVRLADEINDRLGTDLRVCVHTTDSPVPAGELAKCLRKGDIFCHCYQGAGNTIIDENGDIDKGVLEARERGVLFDAANGKGNFGLKTARAAIEKGFLPDIISSDLTVDKFNMPPYDKNLLHVMSKYLAMGVDLMTILKAVTCVPAKIMGLSDRIGSLKPGSLADIAIFEIKDKKYVQKDFRDEEIECSRLILPKLTMIEGEIQYCQSDFYL